MSSKIVTIVGARPQFIKAAALSSALGKDSEIKEVIIHTGQHFDDSMSNIFFDEMGIPSPKYNLKVSGLSHGAMTGRMIEEIEAILIREKPKAALVYGDTNSTLAGALAASKLHIPVIHVEAGLRSFNMRMPEEINRVLTDRISTLLLCPTDQSLINLKKEGFDDMPVTYKKVGDIMQDAAFFFRDVSFARSKILADNRIESESYVLMTLHRAENTSDKDRLTQIINGINAIAANIKVVWPVHPRMRSQIMEYNLNNNILKIEPVGYLDMIKLIENSELIVTDSGGLQKEAYFFNKYCITLRDETEWVELVKNGYNTLVSADSRRIISAYKEFHKKTFTKNSDLYGFAADSIVSEIRALLRN